MMRFSVILACAALLLPVALVRAQAAGDAGNLRRTWVVDVVDRTKDAVVYISAEKIITQRVTPFGNPYWEQTVQRRANSLGSGFIIHPDGYLVTNNHVIDLAHQIKVQLSDGRVLPATLISADAQADLAILKISDSKPLPVLQLGDSSDLMIGEPVVAVGNPFGYSHTVSTGIVSSLHRDLGQTAASLHDLIQTDAAINPGNSGGPLLNAYGQVIGINSAVRLEAQNIGFAIPVDHLRDLIPELMNPALVNKVTMPVKFKEVRTLTPPATVACQVVSADDPARIVRTINGKTPRDIVDAYAMLLGIVPGERLAIVWSAGPEQTLIAHAMPPPPPDSTGQSSQHLGIGVKQVTADIAEQFHLAIKDGLLIISVAADSVGARAGLQPGDVIVRLGRYPVKTLNDMSSLMQMLPSSGGVPIFFVRQDQLCAAVLDLGQPAGQQ
jgi:serine protease Do